VVETVKVDVAVPLAAGVTDVKLNPQVTEAFTGTDAQVNATAELKLFNEVTVIVEVAEFPAITAADTGDAVRLKSFTVKTKIVVLF
jgi:hypothetical protein